MKNKSKETDPGSRARASDLELAQRIHTLVQLVSQHLAATHPTIAPLTGALCWTQPGAFAHPGTCPAPSTGAVPLTWPCFS